MGAATTSGTYHAWVAAWTDPPAELAPIAERLVGRCSGGEQQRLRFALALLPDPALMVLDEPTAGMDVEGRRDFWAALKVRSTTFEVRGIGRV